MTDIFDLNLDPNDPDEPNPALIITMSLILIGSLLKYEFFPNKIP